MKKIQTAGLVVLVLTSLLLVSPVHAVTLRDAREDVRDARQNLVETRKDFREELKEKVASVVGDIRKFIKSKMGFGSGTLTAINGTTLTVSKDGKTYTILTGSFEKCTTQFRRRFWGTSSLSEFRVGDKTNVVGRFTNEDKTTVEACVVRDISIQKRFGVFVGEVTSLLSNGWVMTTVGEKRANQTVTVSSTTTFTNRKEEPIVQSDIKVGNRIRVKGLWNRENNTVTQTTHVKDYSLPVVPTASANVSATVTATITP